eukprot:Rmarinus@m.8604
MTSRGLEISEVLQSQDTSPNGQTRSRSSKRRRVGKTRSRKKDHYKGHCLGNGNGHRNGKCLGNENSHRNGKVLGNRNNHCNGKNLGNGSYRCNGIDSCNGKDVPTGKKSPNGKALCNSLSTGSDGCDGKNLPNGKYASSRKALLRKDDDTVTNGQQVLTLHSLPDDVLFLFFSRLPDEVTLLGSVAKVCRKFRRIAVSHYVRKEVLANENAAHRNSCEKCKGLLPALHNCSIGSELLLLCVRRGELPCIKYLLALGADPTVACLDWPLLHVAASFGQLRVVRFLVEELGFDV